MAKRIRPKAMRVDDWLKAEGIHQEPPRPSKAKRQHKSIPGQLSLIEVDENGKPIVIETKRKRRK